MASSHETPPISTTAAEVTNLSMLAVQQIQQQNDVLPSSTPVEMSQLDSPRSPDVERWATPPTEADAREEYLEAAPQHDSTTSGAQEIDPIQESGVTAHNPSALGIQPSAPTDTTTTTTTTAQPTTKTATPPIQPLPTTEASAIGPSATDPATVITSTPLSTTTTGPSVPITLLLTTGARHPFRIDQPYLAKRNVATRGDDPFSISVYTVKELIWRDWREEWDLRPLGPGAIRLISFGKLLEDRQTLKDCRFAQDTPNVVHMTVKPADLQDDDDHAKSKMGGRGDGDDERSAGCRCCCVM